MIYWTSLVVIAFIALALTILGAIASCNEDRGTDVIGLSLGSIGGGGMIFPAITPPPSEYIIEWWVIFTLCGIFLTGGIIILLKNHKQSRNC